MMFNWQAEYVPWDGNTAHTLFAGVPAFSVKYEVAYWNETFEDSLQEKENIFNVKNV